MKCPVKEVRTSKIPPHGTTEGSLNHRESQLKREKERVLDFAILVEAPRRDSRAAERRAEAVVRYAVRRKPSSFTKPVAGWSPNRQRREAHGGDKGVRTIYSNRSDVFSHRCFPRNPRSQAAVSNNVQMFAVREVIRLVRRAMLDAAQDLAVVKSQVESSFVVRRYRDD